MDKTFTPKISDYTLLAFFLILSIFQSCSPHVEQDKKEVTAYTETAVTPQPKAITVAAIKRTSDEVYFDLIAETRTCLGENLWLGGKLESTDRVVLSSSGAFSKREEFTVTELTATGLSSNNTYYVDNNDQTLSARYDNKGTIYLQLSDGMIQLKPYPSADPIVMAYKANPDDGYYDGSLGQWRCN